MPWSPADAQKHNKSLSGESAKQWSRIANAILAKTGSEGTAIRIANSRAKPSDDAIKRRLKLNG